MEDEELQAIRARRLAELQATSGVRGNTPEREQLERENAERMEERRKAILQQLLTGEARERLSRVKLVKPEKGRQVEEMIIQAAGSGRLGGRVDEAQLINLLEQIAEHTKKETKVTVLRRRDIDDDPSPASAAKEEDEEDV